MASSGIKSAPPSTPTPNCSKLSAAIEKAKESVKAVTKKQSLEDTFLEVSKYVLLPYLSLSG